MARSAPPLFRRFRERAGKLVDSPEKLGALLREAARKAPRLEGRPGPLEAALKDLKVFVDLLRAWLSGSYTGVDKSSIVMVVAAVLYFVMPLDLVFDGIPGLGFVDDATVLTYVLGRVRAEIEDFRGWRASPEFAPPR